MPRIARVVSPARANAGVPTSPPRTRRGRKRTASQALPPTPPRTVKRERKTRFRGRTTSDKPKSRSPTRTRSRAPALETVLEESDEAEQEVSIGATVGRRLDFGPATKRRKLEELDARLETLLESLDGEDAENPFWDGPSKVNPSDPVDKVEKADNKTETGAKRESTDKHEGSREEESSEKTVRIRSPSPPLLSFRGKAPVSPPPSNRRKKKVRGKAATVTETIVEEKAETEGEQTAESSVTQPAETLGEPSTIARDEQPSESTGESPDEAVVNTKSLEPSEEPSKPRIASFPVEREGRTATSADDIPLVDLPPMPSTPKKGKKRMDSPIRDSPNNPFLDDSPASVTGEPAEPRTPTVHAEKPTITYVFRGVRAEFANPVYNLPPEVHERSLLPVEHPDYSPDPACPPKLLFPKSHRRQASPSPTRRSKGRSQTRSSAAAPSTGPTNGWDDSDDEAELHLTPPSRLFH